MTGVNSISLYIQGHSYKNCQNISEINFSTGIFGYPSTRAAPVALKTVKNFITENIEKIDRVVFCVFLQNDLKIYEKQLQMFFPVSWKETFVCVH